MNINSLNMINFGIFRDRKLEFCPGLNLIFGPNESGKTTVVDAIVLALLSRTDKKGAKLKGYPRALKAVKDRYGSEISLQIVVEHNTQELSFPSSVSFQDRWDVGWDELRAIFIAREGDLELVKGDPREFRQWWDALKGKLLGFEEEPSQVLKKIAAEAGLTPSLGLTRTQQDRIKEAQDKLHWYQENEKNIRSLRTLESAHRDLQLDEKRLIQEMEQAKKGLRKTTLIRAQKIYQQMKAAQQELLEKHGRYTEKDLSDWIKLQGDLRGEQGLLDRAVQHKKEEDRKRKERVSEATQLFNQIGALSSQLGPIAAKEAELNKAARQEAKEQIGEIPVWAPWAAWALTIFALILGLATTKFLLIACALLAAVAISFTYKLLRATKEEQQTKRQLEKYLPWGREMGLEATSLRDLQQKIEGLRREKEKLQGRLAQLQDQLQDLKNSVENLAKQEGMKEKGVKKIHSQIQNLRQKTGLSDLEELQNRIKTKNELCSNVEKKFKSELKVLLGPDEASWPGALDELKALEDIHAVQDEQHMENLSKKLEACRAEQEAKFRELTNLKANIKAEFKVQKPEEVIWKVDDLRQELREMDILERAGQKVRQVFEQLLQRSDAVLDDIIGGERVCEGFSRITGGKYRAVTMEDLVLRAIDAQGKTWYFQDLSTGTRDQLLTVLRLALAEKRLQGKGFLIFDDALVTSDRTRLREQMEMLGQLTQAGWQILFMTAQDEVRQEAERLAGLEMEVRIVDL